MKICPGILKNLKSKKLKLKRKTKWGFYDSFCIVHFVRHFSVSRFLSTFSSDNFSVMHFFITFHPSSVCFFVFEFFHPCIFHLCIYLYRRFLSVYFFLPMFLGSHFFSMCKFSSHRFLCGEFSVNIFFVHIFLCLHIFRLADIFILQFLSMYVFCPCIFCTHIFHVLFFAYFSKIMFDRKMMSRRNM